jgi:hypothetical protein
MQLHGENTDSASQHEVPHPCSLAPSEWASAAPLTNDSQLVCGVSGVATEVGHMLVAPGGRVCGCALSGCWDVVLIRAGAPQRRSTERRDRTRCWHQTASGRIRGRAVVEVRSRPTTFRWRSW